MTSTSPGPQSTPPNSTWNSLRRHILPISAVLLLICLVILPYRFVRNVTGHDPKEMPAVKILNSTGERSASWERKEAVKFSLDQLESSINYLFLAAAAGLTLIGKLVFEPETSATPKQARPRGVLIALLLSGCSRSGH